MHACIHVQVKCSTNLMCSEVVVKKGEHIFNSKTGVISFKAQD